MDTLIWHKEYEGRLAADSVGSDCSTELMGFHFRKEQVGKSVAFSDSGAYFGFVMSGEVAINNPDINDWVVRTGQWFSVPHSMTIRHLSREQDSRVVVIFQKDYVGLYSMGGPVENRGRLRYIDGCSDTLLLCPPRLGDPCLNLLHFPKRVKQTMHNHPSARMGAVIGGSGLYITQTHTFELKPGSIFYIPTGVYHHFETKESTLDVFAYHPDSDWGPQDEVHPMINRTWVNGKKIEQVNHHEAVFL